MNVLEDRRVLGQRQVGQLAEPVQRLIHPGVPGGHDVARAAPFPGEVPGAAGPGAPGSFSVTSRSSAGLRAAGRFSDERYRPGTAAGATNAWRHAHGAING